MLGDKYKINENVIRASFDEDDDHMAGASIVTLKQLLKKEVIKDVSQSVL